MNNESSRISKLSNKLIKGILEIEETYFNGHLEKRLPHINNFRFLYIEGESLLLRLDFEGIAGSTGSACSSKSLEPSHVLRALGLKKTQIHGSLRLSLGKYTTEEEIDYVLEVLPKTVKKLREMSPLYKPS